MTGKKFTTTSSHPIKELYTPEDLKDFNSEKELGKPGHYPFTRGPYETMYRGKLWTMRQFAGFGTPEDTNKRFRYLLDHGVHGLSTAFDMPTLMGYDADHLLAVPILEGSSDRHQKGQTGDPEVLP